MLSLVNNYKEEAQAQYLNTLKELNNSAKSEKGIMNRQLYKYQRILGLSIKAIFQYEEEKTILEKDIRISMGLTVIKTIITKTKK
jgi:hypothetical protein